MKRRHITPLPFQTLTKRWQGIWWRKVLVGLGSFIVIILALYYFAGLFSISHITEPLTSTALGLAKDICSGVFGGLVVAGTLWFRKATHNRMHYAKELRFYVNNAQQRYQLSFEEAGDLLIYDEPQLTPLDDFLRQVGTKKEAETLPKIQRFGSVIIPHEKHYLRITFYWQAAKGFFLVEETLTDLPTG